MSRRVSVACASRRTSTMTKRMWIASSRRWKPRRPDPCCRGALWLPPLLHSWPVRRSRRTIRRSVRISIAAILYSVGYSLSASTLKVRCRNWPGTELHSMRSRTAGTNRLLSTLDTRTVAASDGHSRLSAAISFAVVASDLLQFNFPRRRRPSVIIASASPQNSTARRPASSDVSAWSRTNKWARSVTRSLHVPAELNHERAFDIGKSGLSSNWRHLSTRR